MFLYIPLLHGMGKPVGSYCYWKSISADCGEGKYSFYFKGQAGNMGSSPHSSTLAWKIPWTEEPGGLQSMGSLRVRHTERLHFHFSLSCIGEGNGNPLQCSSLENPRDGRAWWAAVYGVAQSRTQLTRFSSSSSNALKTKLPNVFQRRVFKCTVKEGSLWVCDQLMHNSLIGWWWHHWMESQVNIIMCQAVWKLCV